MRARIWTALVVAIGVLASGAEAADRDDTAGAKPLSILFIGNSYTSVNDLPGMVQQIAVHAGRPKPLVAASTPGGCTWAKHLETAKTLQAIDQAGADGHGWDVVVLQEQSQTPAVAAVSPPVSQAMIRGAVELAKRVRTKSPHARLVLYETWARHAELWTKKPAEMRGLGANAGDMQARIRSAYAGTAAEMLRQRAGKVSLAPVGDFWEMVGRLPQPIRLHGNDGSHPNSAGTFLAGLVIYTVIYQKSPADLRFVPHAVSQGDAGTLQGLVAAKWESLSQSQPSRTKKRAPP